MAYYQFYNQYGTELHYGYHANDEEAWEGFFNTCKYPRGERNIEKQKEMGISFTKTS